MFNNDLTTNFNQQDASTEIIIMLAGAFLLGALLSWVIGKVMAGEKKPQAIIPEVESVKEKDDLTKISRIDKSTLKHLNKSGIQTFLDLKALDHKGIKTLFSTDNNDPSFLREAETWPHQATLAANGDWDKLNDYQALVERAKEASKKAEKAHQPDDLKKIKGIDSKIENILKNNNIQSFKDLGKTDSTALKTLIVQANSDYKDHDVESWPYQADMADKGQWEELNIYQEFMDEDNTEADIETLNTEIKDLDKSLASEKTSNDKPVIKLATDNKTDKKAKSDFIDSSVYKLNDNKLKVVNEKDISENKDTQVSDTEKNATKSTASTDKEKNKKDDFKRIDGIGPKIQTLLNDNNINSYEDLYATDSKKIKNILNAAGTAYQIHEPETWPHQAGLARKGKWEELNAYQEFMSGGKDLLSAPTPFSNTISTSPLPATSSSSSSSSSSKKENDINKKTTNAARSAKKLASKHRDDLKKIEGIGPKIEAVLFDAGITTFEYLKNSDRNTLKALLEAAGPQYKMHEPETWPHQAKMAFNKEWKKLGDYQDYLLGGRDPS